VLLLTDDRNKVALKKMNNLSYARAPNNGKFDYLTVKELLERWAKRQPNNDAFVGYNADGTRTSITSEKILETSVNAAKYLVKFGMKKEDIVVFCTNNSIQMLQMLFGAQIAGGIPLFTLCSTSDGSDVIEIVNNAEAKWVVMDSNGQESMQRLFKRLMESEELKQKERRVLTIDNDTIRYFDIIKTQDPMLLDLNTHEASSGETTVQLPTLYPEDIAMYYKTSGSTGKPKLVGHSHVTFQNCTHGINAVMELKCGDRFFCDRPFAWGVGTPRNYLATGATRVFADTNMFLHKNNAGSFITSMSSACM